MKTIVIIIIITIKITITITITISITKYYYGTHFIAVKLTKKR